MFDERHYVERAVLGGSLVVFGGFKVEEGLEGDGVLLSVDAPCDGILIFTHIYIQRSILAVDGAGGARQWCWCWWGAPPCSSQQVFGIAAVARAVFQKAVF